MPLKLLASSEASARSCHNTHNIFWLETVPFTSKSNSSNAQPPSMIKINVIRIAELRIKVVRTKLTKANRQIEAYTIDADIPRASAVQWIEGSIQWASASGLNHQNPHNGEKRSARHASFAMVM